MEQLGLKLESARSQVQALVIDNAKRRAAESLVAFAH
jgi:uncharacterized protein (TIGR03435 family)